MGLQGSRLFSGGPHSAVNDAGPSPYTGGARVPAGTPTDVGAGGFTHLKASAPPPILNTAGINLASHSRSANQRVVYTRVVQMHNNWPTKVPHTNKWSLSGTKEAFEYDQLQAFELAWSYRAEEGTNGIELSKVAPTSEMSLRDRDQDYYENYIKNSAQPKTYGHMTPRGFKGQGPGTGIERMLRLAATPWVEEVFENHIGRQAIDLRTVPITKSASDPYDKTCYDSEIDFFHRVICEQNAEWVDFNSGTVLNAPDVNNVLGGSHCGPQGLNVLADGCFLISKSLSEETDEIPFKQVKHTASMAVPKNLGGKLAQRALLVELRRRGLLSWQPDGICLSKFESSDSVAQNAAYDAQMSQLFNVAVQGPSITNVWTFDSDMVTTPGDKVFMLLVGTVRLQVSQASTAFALKNQEDENAFRSSLSDYYKEQDIEVGSWTLSECTLSDFRLMRATSSYLVEHSLPSVNVAKSRCGLADNGFNSQSVKEGQEIAREYILGGWCIGTVMDSAASRAVSHNMPYASQHTMAINVNVNIEWWDADQLHLAYQNKGRGGNNIIRTRLEAAHYEERPRNHVVRTDTAESLEEVNRIAKLEEELAAINYELNKLAGQLNDLNDLLGGATDEEIRIQIQRDIDTKEPGMRQLSAGVLYTEGEIYKARGIVSTKAQLYQLATLSEDIEKMALEVINNEVEYNRASAALEAAERTLQSADEERRGQMKDEVEELRNIFSKTPQPYATHWFTPIVERARRAAAATARAASS